MGIAKGQPKSRLTIQGKIMGDTITRKNNKQQGEVSRVLIHPPVEHQQNDGNKYGEYGYEEEHV